MKFFNTLLLTLIVIIFAAACGNLSEEGQNVTAGNSNGLTDADIQPTLSGPYIGDGDSQNYSYLAQLPTLSRAYDNGTSGHPFLKDYFGKGDAYYNSYHNNWFDWTQRDHNHGFMEDNIQVVPSLGGTNATKGSVRFPHSYHQDISKYTDLIGNCTTNCHTRYVDRDTKPYQVAPPCNTARDPNAVCTTQTHSKIVFKQKIQVGDVRDYKEFLFKLVDMGYTRNNTTFERGNFRVNGESVDVFPAYNEIEFVRIEFFGNEIDRISIWDEIERKEVRKLESYVLYAANQFIVGANRLQQALKNIQQELDSRLYEFEQEGKMVEHSRLKGRTEFDLEMIKESGICKGIENYARHLTGKLPGETPYCLLDYFEQKGKPYLVIVDESHVSLPQFGGMYAGDRSRKEVLVEYGFRLPSALDNRPLRFDEFISKAPHFLFVSATPAKLELDLSQNHIAEQIIRPTGLLDPLYEVRDSDNQVLDLYDEIKIRIEKKQRILITTLTKKMAEELTKYYTELGIKVRYMHSDIDAIERNHLIRELRLGEFDVLVGINLLREGLDLPEVSLIAILDADKEGFLRSETSLIQTMGRAARNIEGKVILYAKHITGSMQKAFEVTDYRRAKQEAFNKQHNITPKGVSRSLEDELRLEGSGDLYEKASKKAKIPKTEKEAIIKELKKKMLQAAKDLEFEEAARLRDEIAKLRAN